ncbi:MAG: hypothetical protein JNN30_16875 [Rhodanobacteraceae bacterium]|nr:hypothetical protein [Rhodanobacteraceae bacterium]
MRSTLLIVATALLVTACGGSLKVRYDLLDRHYVKRAMLEQRIPEQIRAVRGICSQEACISDVESNQAAERIRQAQVKAANIWTTIDKLCHGFELPCEKHTKLEADVLAPHFNSLRQISARLDSALRKNKQRFDSEELGKVPLEIRELAMARASAVDALADATKTAIANYEQFSTETAIHTVGAASSEISEQATKGNALERSRVLGKFADVAVSIDLFSHPTTDKETVQNARDKAAADAEKLERKIREVAKKGSAASDAQLSLALDDPAVAKKNEVKEIAIAQQQANDELQKGLTNFFRQLAKETPRELTTSSRELSGFRLDRAKEAYTVAHAPDEYWSEKYQKAYGRGILGNLNVAVKYTPPNLATEGSVGSFNIKGLTFDPSQVTQMASKALTQGLLMYTQMATGRLPSPETPAAGASATNATSTNLATEVGNARRALALYDAQLNDRQIALQDLHELVRAMMPEGTSSDPAKRQEAAKSLQRWLKTNKDRLSPALTGGTASTSTTAPATN